MRKIPLILILSVLLFPFIILAQTTIENPLTSTNFADFIDRITNFLFYIAVVLAPLMIVIGGAYYIMSGGDPGKTKQARQIMIYAAVGLIVMVLARAFVNVILRQIL